MLCTIHKIEMDVSDPVTGTLNTRNLLIETIADKWAGLPLQAREMHSFKSLEEFFLKSGWGINTTPSYTGNRLLFMIQYYQKKNQSHASISEAAVANTIIHDMIRICGDKDGNMWPFLHGKLPARASIAALHRILDELPQEIQEEIIVMHPMNHTLPFDASTESEDADVIGFWELMVKHLTVLNTAIRAVRIQPAPRHYNSGNSDR